MPVKISTSLLKKQPKFNTKHDSQNDTFINSSYLSFGNKVSNVPEEIKRAIHANNSKGLQELWQNYPNEIENVLKGHLFIEKHVSDYIDRELGFKDTGRYFNIYSGHAKKQSHS